MGKEKTIMKERWHMSNAKRKWRKDVKKNIENRKNGDFQFKKKATIKEDKM